MIIASLINMYQNLTKFQYGRILTRLRNDQSILNEAKSEHKKELSEEGIIKYERKDDMLFGEWQAQMMLEKGQTTEGVRVDKKIVINPLFKGNFGGKFQGKLKYNGGNQVEYDDDEGKLDLSEIINGVGLSRGKIW